jgi:AraC-like DNA-binding protein
MVKKTERFWLRTGGPVWPIDVRSIGFRNEPFPFVAERPAGDNFFIIMWTVTGRGFLKTNDKDFELKSGILFIMPPNMAHAYGGIMWEDEWVKWWFTLDGGMAQPMMKALGMDSLLVVNSGSCPENDFKNLLNASVVPGMTGEIQRARNAFSIIYQINARLKQKYTGIYRKRFDDIVEWVRKNMDAGTNVDFMARKAGMTRSHFSREFTRDMGVSPKDFIIQVKLDQAKHLLATTTLSVKQIADRSGWYDTAHFCRQFVRLVGMTPKEYRKSLKI